MRLSMGSRSAMLRSQRWELRAFRNAGDVRVLISAAMLLCCAALGHRRWERRSVMEERPQQQAGERCDDSSGVHGAVVGKS